jgi:succinoglycan biosynthesis protein ExoA
VSPRDSAGKEAAPLISIIVPVRNEAKCIERTLARLVTQRYDPRRFEVIVVDGESSDGTPELVAKFARRHDNVRLFCNARRLSSAARNIGIREARGDVVVVVDGHCELQDDGYLAALAAAFQQSGADCVGRPQPLDIAAASPLQRAIAAARSSRLGHHPDSHVYSGREGFVPAKSVAVAYRRSVFERVGGFDERFDACEDVEFNHRVDCAGLRCYFTPRLAAAYRPRDNLRDLFRQLARYGRGRVRLLRAHPETFRLPTFLPALFVLGCLAGLGAMWWPYWLRAAYLLALALYGASVATASLVAAARGRDVMALFWLPLVFFTIHAGAGCGILFEFCFPAAAPQSAAAESAGARQVEGSGRCESW